MNVHEEVVEEHELHARKWVRVSRKIYRSLSAR